MKFRELPLKNRFSISSFPGIIFLKVPQKKGTCCTPAHNVIYSDEKGGKQSKLLDGDITVTPEDSPIPIEPKKKKDPKNTRANSQKHTRQTIKQSSTRAFKKRGVTQSNRGGGKWGFQP